MFGIIVVLLLLFIFDIAAMRWGYGSRDELMSKEWDRRRQCKWLLE